MHIIMLNVSINVSLLYRNTYTHTHTQRVGVFTKLVKSTFGGSSKGDPSSPASPSDSTEAGSTTLDFSTNINSSWSSYTLRFDISANITSI